MEGVRGFYIAGEVPKEYIDGERVSLIVNKLVSPNNLITYPYYYLPFCTPSEMISYSENLGLLLSGDSFHNSPYLIEAGIDVKCKVLCRKRVTMDQLQLFESSIKDHYFINWKLDGLPAAMKRVVVDHNGKQSYVYEQGFSLGTVEVQGSIAYLNNHVRMKVLYSLAPFYLGRRIVGFEIEPHSILHDREDEEGKEYPKTCTHPKQWQPVTLNNQTRSLFSFNADQTIDLTFTYSVDWEFAPIKWNERWDAYLKISDLQIHYFSIINSLLLILFLSGIIAFIFIRSLLSSNHSSPSSSSMIKAEGEEENGWKCLRGDFFRAPKNPLIFSSLIGSGLQIYFVALFIIFLALFGFLSPANPGYLTSNSLFLFFFLGGAGGYFASQLYRTLSPKSNKFFRSFLLTVLGFPSAIFIIYFILNLVMGIEHSSAYLHFWRMVEIIILWVVICIPLTFAGSYYGFRHPLKGELTSKMNVMKRAIPRQPWYLSPAVSILLGGVFPFTTLLVELYFIFSSLWLHQYYYMFEYLFVVIIILSITSAEVAMIVCYFQLCNENYEWWWRSFFSTSSSALYVFLYAIYFYYFELEITSTVSTIVYFGYSFVISLFVFMVTGAIGFYSSFYFVSKIFGVIKSD